MDNKPDYRQLAYHLKSLLPILEIDPSSVLYKDILSICNFLEKTTFRIAVFAPFNHGKSTLLNALLGQKTLPIDLIPTTGAAISLRYGKELSTKITLKNGDIINEKGTEILKKYAVLDEQRRMNDDVVSVEVFCDDYFLKMGVEFIDLPGTNDREEQNNLVKEKLLSVDLIVHVLDARKLMTLEERENLRDWLLDRGIDTVIFVVNFLNLLELEEQKQVQNRLIFVAESFRSRLPQGVSNLYRVDALPALRARLKGDTATSQTTGLASLETALQTIVRFQQNNPEIYLDRVKKIGDRLRQIAEDKKQTIVTTIATEKQKQKTKQELTSKAKQLILQGLQKSISEMESWLYFPNLCSRYQKDLANALQRNNFNFWQEKELQSQLDKYQDNISDWIKKSADFFSECKLGQLQIELPPSPAIVIPEPENNKQNIDDRSSLFQTVDRVMNKVIGVTLSEGINYIFDRTDDRKEVPNSTTNNYDDRDYKIYFTAAEAYLQKFSQTAFERLKQYQQQAERAIELPQQQTSFNYSKNEHQIQLIDSLIDRLQQELENCVIY
jgi:Dynamin family